MGGIHTAERGKIESAPAASTAEMRAIASVVQTASEKLGDDVAKELQRYFATERGDAYKVTGNGGSGSCWVNAPEDWYLKNNKAQLARFIESLIRDGSMTADDFRRPDERADAQLGKRFGTSLALDRACEKTMNCPFGATDFVIERFESKIRGEKTISVFNGIASDGKDHSGDLQKIIDKPADAKGLRCSVIWLTGPVDPVTGAASPVCHQITIEKIENGRVYFYQPVSIEGIKGPDRRWEKEMGEGLESMTIDQFKHVARSIFVPESVRKDLGIHRSIDPAYYTSTDTETPRVNDPGSKTPIRPDAIKWLTAQLLLDVLYHGAGKNGSKDDGHTAGAKKDDEEKRMKPYEYRDILAGKGV